ncbi:MAG: hypothetical protein QGD92_07630 [Gammaproteobacteria bacterium]|nr:hypothetical protein [Gammaproteobacteria bacterium]
MATKNIPAPGYTTTKGLLPSIKRMFDGVGAQDACIQLQELSIQYLCNSAEATRAPIGDFLKLLYRWNNIPHGTYDFDELLELASKSYLTATYALLEKMLRAIISEYKNNNPSVVKGWKKQNSQGENFSPLQELAENLPSKQSATLKNAPEYRLLEYYRLVRIANSHHKGETLRNAGKAHSAITAADIAHFQTYDPAVMAPNAPEGICFEDFLLFTRAIKYYSKLLNEACA